MTQAVNVPGVGKLNFPDGMSQQEMAAAIQKNYPQIHGGQAADPNRPETDEDVNARVAKQYAGMSFGDKVKGDLKSAVSGVTPILRGAWDAVSAVPGLAADAGVGLRNAVTGSNYELPSRMSENSLDTALPMPNTPGAKAMRFGTSMLVGAKIPGPEAAQQAPANYVKPSQDLVRQQTLSESQRAGYVVPPSTTNPTIKNRLLESFGGKVATAQDAAAKNQDITNALAKRAVGLNEDAPLTQSALAAVRKEAGDAYATLRKVGSVALDDTSSKSLDAVASKFSGSKLKEALGGGTDIPKIVQALKDEPLTGDTAVDAIDLLRGKASKAYAQGDKEIGKAYRTLSETVENLMERNLSGDALKEFRDARKLIAKTYTVENALNESTGGVSATKLAVQLGKGKPLSDELLTAAKFGQAFPKAAQSITDSGAVRNTDVVVGGVTAAASKEPGWLVYPFARQGARSFLLSNIGQKMAVPAASSKPPVRSAIAALIAEEQARKSAGQ